MKSVCPLLVALVWVSGLALVQGDSANGSPVARVVSLLTDLKAKIHADGKSEEQSYDKFACWAEKTLARKAEDISAAKERIEELQTLIYKLAGNLGSLGANIPQLEKDIAANIESTREATEVRNKGAVEYQEERTESEQCIGALEAAIKVLTGANSKKGFLETLQEAQLLSAVAGVRDMLQSPQVSKSVSGKDLEVVKRFVERPEQFVGAHDESLTAVQIANNPFGDYAPQSTQIQGILKGMYDAFAADLEKSNAEEAEKQKAFEELMETKKAELAALQATLDKATGDNADKARQLANSRTELDDTKTQLEADEKFFAVTKESAKTKAQEWAQRTRLRTEELSAIGKAIEILNSPEARKTFESATSNEPTASASGAPSPARAALFLQLSALPHKKAYGKLKILAKKYGTLSLAKVADQVMSGGHFDRVIQMIDQMIGMLRKEEQDDIAHRNRCQSSEKKNKNEREDLTSDIEKAGKELERMTNVEEKLKTQLDKLVTDINVTNDEMADQKKIRIAEHKEFKTSLKDDVDAVSLLGEALVVLAKFYEGNKIQLVQEEPAATENPDAAPETSWAGGDYGGRTKESTGIIAILSMIKEDLEKEVKSGREDDATAQKKYSLNRKAMQESLDAQVATKVQTEKDLAAHQAKIADKEEFVEEKTADLDAAEELQATLEKDCAWVETNFDSRRDKRKTEIDGLIEAKNILAGAEVDGDGDDF